MTDIVINSNFANRPEQRSNATYHEACGAGQSWSCAYFRRVDRNRITQIMNLLLLAPDIQERFLFLPRVESGPEPIYLKDLQRVAKVTGWEGQRGICGEILAEI